MNDPRVIVEIDRYHARYHESALNPSSGATRARRESKLAFVIDARRDFLPFPSLRNRPRPFDPLRIRLCTRVYVSADAVVLTYFLLDPRRHRRQNVVATLLGIYFLQDHRLVVISILEDSI